MDSVSKEDKIGIPGYDPRITGTNHGARNTPYVELGEKDLWQNLHSIGNEMLISRGGGLLNPRLTVKIFNLHQDKFYKVMVDCEPKDNFQYRFDGLNWYTHSTTSRIEHESYYTHPSSPASGGMWMENPVTFPDLRLTNTSSNHENQIVLNSMKKYQPKIHIVECLSPMELTPIDSWVYAFNETEFISITGGYKNRQVREMKKESASQLRRTAYGMGQQQHGSDLHPMRNQERSAANNPMVNHTNEMAIHGLHQVPNYSCQGNVNGFSGYARQPPTMMQGMSILERLLTMNMFRQFHLLTADSNNYWDYARAMEPTTMEYDYSTQVDYTNQHAGNETNNDPYVSNPGTSQNQ